jgi:hypothetical protein
MQLGMTSLILFRFEILLGFNEVAFGGWIGLSDFGK